MIFGRDLLKKDARDERLAHMVALVLAALTGKSGRGIAGMVEGAESRAPARSAGVGVPICRGVARVGGRSRIPRQSGIGRSRRATDSPLAPGKTLHPRSRVRVAQEKRTRAYRFSGSTPAFPAQWLYGLLRALPGDRLFCHRRSARTGFRADLTPAPGRQDHTTSPYAHATYVSRSHRVHRIPPHVRDDRERPSSAGDGRS